MIYFIRIKKNKVVEKKEKEENIREGEEIQKLVKIHEWEQKKLEEVKRQEKINIMMSHKEHVANKYVIDLLAHWICFSS